MESDWLSVLLFSLKGGRKKALEKQFSFQGHKPLTLLNMRCQESTLKIPALSPKWNVRKMVSVQREAPGQGTPRAAFKEEAEPS